MRPYLHITKKHTKEFIIEIICTVLLTLTILFLCNMLNAPFQTLKNVYASKAFLCFSIYLIFIQRPRIINLPTAIVTLIYIPIGYTYRTRYIMYPDLFNRDKIVVWIVYFLLIILVDMFYYKKINNFQRMNKPSLFIYLFMTVCMICFRNNSTMPALLILMFIVYLIPLTSSNWNRVLHQFQNSWIISFIIILIQSLRLNPSISEIGRWYGCFVNIGEFGLFLACVFAILFSRIHMAKKRYSILSFPFMLYIIIFFSLLWTILRVSTITMYIGILFLFIMLYILFTKNGTYSETLFRLMTAITTIIVIGCLGFITLKSIAMYADKEYWYQVFHEENILIKPIANIVTRAFEMFEEPRTFADGGVFVPDSIINYLDLFSSGRLSLIKLFSEHFTLTGTSSLEGVQVGFFFAPNAHNTYVQTLVEYGYIAGCSHIIWLLYSTIASVRKFLHEKKLNNLFLCLWMAVILGVLTGECARLYNPIIFATLFFTYPLMVNVPNKNSCP